MCEECNNFQYSKSIFMVSDFKIFLVVFLKFHVSLICSFFYCLVKEGLKLLSN